MRFICIVLAMAFFLPLNPGAPRADIDIGVSIGEEGITGFYLAVSDYYRVPEQEVVVIKKRRIPDEEIPVVFFVAGRAGVSYSAIIDLRLKGLSWMDITLRLGLGPDIFYVPVKGEVKSPPYGKAYGYYAKKGKKTSSLGDADVVNLVNLKFLSEHYGVSPEAVIEMRSGGKNFVSINDEIKKKKGGKGNGNGNNKGKGKGSGR